MRSKSSIQNELLAYITIFFVLLFSACYLKFRYSWWDSFFEAIEGSEINSYRLYSIVTPGDLADPIFIREVRSFGQAVSSRYDQTNIKMRTEFWYTPDCSEMMIENFQQSVGNAHFFHYRPLQESVDLMIKRGAPAALNKNILSPLTLNVVKLWSLDDPFSLNVHLDPVLWKRYAVSKSKIPSSAAFGMLALKSEERTFFINFIFPENDKNDLKIMSVNNDCLIGVAASPDVRIAKNLLAQSFERSRPEIELLVMRPLMLESSSLSAESYARCLEERLEWHKANPHIAFEDEMRISQLSGAYFLYDLIGDYVLARAYCLLGSDPSLEQQSRLIKKMTTYGDLVRRDCPNRDIVAIHLLMENDLKLLPPHHPNRDIIKNACISSPYRV